MIVAASDAARRAEVGEDATLAERPPSIAHAPSMPDQEVREQSPLAPRDDLRQIALDLHGILLAGETEPLREPADMRVDHDPLRVAELRGDDVRRLPRHARE